MENSVYLSNYSALKENLALKEKLRIWFKNINHPKYQRYFEEWWNEMLKHQPFGWLREKVNKKEMIHIGRVFDVSDDTLITLSINEGRNYNSSYFFRTYTFADGSPFGIKLELL